MNCFNNQSTSSSIIQLLPVLRYNTISFQLILKCLSSFQEKNYYLQLVVVWQ